MTAVRRGRANEQRDVAIYLIRILRAERLEAIGAVFHLNRYSSVSSVVHRVKSRMQRDAKFKERIEEVKDTLLKGQSKTPSPNKNGDLTMLEFLKDLDNDIRDALLAQLRNLWTHTSTAIEGNALSLEETAFVLEEGLTISGKPLKDHEEVVGHARAIDLVYDFVRRESRLTEKDLFDLHKAVQTERIMDVYEPVGAWKAEPNSTVIVSGNDQIIFEYASPKDVPELMQAWLALFQKTCRENAVNKEAVLSAYASLHVSFVRIHPFWDGNGRMARLIANFPVIRAGFPPIIIPKERRQEYIEALSEYHLAVGSATSGSELLPELDRLDRFKRFCSES